MTSSKKIISISFLLLFFVFQHSVKGEITIHRTDFLDMNAACPKTPYTDGYWVNVDSRFKAYEWKITGGSFIDRYGQSKESIIIRQADIYQGQSKIYVTVVWNNVASTDGKKSPIGTITINGYNSEFLIESNIEDKGKREQEIKSLKDMVPPSLDSSVSPPVLNFGKQDVRVFFIGAFNYPGIKKNGSPVPVTQYEWQIPAGWTATTGSATSSGTYLTTTSEIQLITDASSGGEVKVRGVNDCDGSGDYSDYTWITFTRKAGIHFVEYPQTVPMGEIGTHEFSVLLSSGVSFEWQAPAGWSINGGGSTYTGGNVVQITTSECPTNEKVKVRLVLGSDYSEWAEFPTTVELPAINLPSGEIKQYQPATFSLDMPDDGIDRVEWLVNGNSMGTAMNTSTLSFQINEPGQVNVSAKITMTDCAVVTIPEVEVDVIKAPDPVITGPYTLSGTDTYTIDGFENLPEGATVQWSAGNNNISLISQQGSTAIFRGDMYGESSILATINLGENSVTLPSFPLMVEIDLSPLNNVYITGPDFVCDPTAMFSLANLPDSAWVSWDHGKFTAERDPYTVIISSYTGKPGVAKVEAEITYKGKPQGIVHEHYFNFNFPGTWYVGDSIMMNSGIYYDSYRNIVTLSVTYLYPTNGNYYEWSCSASNWQLVSGGTDYAMFEGPPVDEYVNITMCFNNPCGKRTCFVREFYLPDEIPGGYIPFNIFLDPSTSMVNVELQEGVFSSLGTRSGVNAGAYEIQLWNMGSMLRRYTTGETTFQFSVADLPGGIYIVRVIKNGKSYAKKLIKK